MCFITGNRRAIAYVLKNQDHLIAVGLEKLRYVRPRYLPEEEQVAHLKSKELRV
jgi:hypothetical protein